MLETILKVLKDNNIIKYIVTEKEEETYELYLIKDKVDMNRKKKVKTYSVKVFKDFTEEGVDYTGDSKVVVYPSMSEEDVKEAVLSAYFSAGFVKNKEYDIPVGVVASKEEKSNLADEPLEDTILKIKDALYKYDNQEKGWINSAEIFLTRFKARSVTSKGADISFVKYNTSGEFITQWVENSDVEAYNSFNYDNLNAEELSQKVKEGLIDTGYRDKAVNPPKTGKYNVILKDNDVISFLNYYLDNGNASMIYQKYSNFKIGDKVQGENVKGDKLNIKLNSSVPFSIEGLELKQIPLIEDGVLKNIHGSFRFLEYLGLKQVGSYDGAIVEGGNIPYKDILQDGDLLISRFSDFQMDSLTGDIGGEIRLALLKDGDNIVKLTGGSLSANIKDLQENMKFSKETQSFGAYTVPKAVKLENVEISGM